MEYYAQHELLGFPPDKRRWRQVTGRVATSQISMPIISFLVVAVVSGRCRLQFDLVALVEYRSRCLGFSLLSFWPNLTPGKILGYFGHKSFVGLIAFNRESI
jgi:hypothetical protein